MTRWVIRHYGGRYVLMYDGQYVAESDNPIVLILRVSYRRVQVGVMQ